MRIMRGLSSRVLTCGCLAGVYETYDGEIVGILDARDASCGDPRHQPGAAVSRRRAEAVRAAAGEQPGGPPSDGR
jgi:hypothetical protein